jgi:pyruvate/2-oxoglutarate dehydrogenase complex dihydrolipoamide dehydrogenase (E3) component
MDVVLTYVFMLLYRVLPAQCTVIQFNTIRHRYTKHNITHHNITLYISAIGRYSDTAGLGLDAVGVTTNQKTGKVKHSLLL